MGILAGPSWRQRSDQRHFANIFSEIERNETHFCRHRCQPWHRPVAESRRRGNLVNTVTPGLTETDMASADRIAHEGPTIPIGRVVQPEEIAEAIL